MLMRLDVLTFLKNNTGPRPYTPFAWGGAGAGRGAADSTGRCSAREGHLTRTAVSLPGGCSTCERPRPYTPFAWRGAGAGRGDADSTGRCRAREGHLTRYRA